MCFGRSKVPSHRDGSFEYPKYMLWSETKKREIIYLRSFQDESVQLQGAVRQNFISVQLRKCAGSSEPYLLQLC